MQGIWAWKGTGQPYTCRLRIFDVRLTYKRHTNNILAMKTLKSYRFDDQTVQLIEELKSDLRLENNSAVLRRAVTLLKIACETKANGGKLIFKDVDGERELVL